MMFASHSALLYIQSPLFGFSINFKDVLKEVIFMVSTDLLLTPTIKKHFDASAIFGCLGRLASDFDLDKNFGFSGFKDGKNPDYDDSDHESRGDFLQINQFVTYKDWETFAVTRAFHPSM